MMGYNYGLCHFKNGQVKCTYVQSLHLDLYKMDVSFYIYMVQLKKAPQGYFFLFRQNNIYTKRVQWHTNTYVWQKLKKNAQYIFYLHIFISWKKVCVGGGDSALNIFSIFYTHHRSPIKHMMTINFDMT
jgi:hypothetical protein